MKAHLTHPVFPVISQCCEEMGVHAFVIGGWVRDLLLGRPSKDIDIVCAGSGIDLAEKVAQKMGGLQVTVFRNFGTA
ncbi:MAG TPA: tRNA nucleotidyltransferase, partial [Bacteroidia bacterium]|nr:tRNA nucleotidyltransferase [Bacteroidia bacterium]